ncbi:hypothetical protein [Pontibacter sp. G13]|uniref:hypothetical protein n=1 Tax=Pontibacter sp. G13 TaxID=3074898 RepID=UPI00288BEED8|nr:hypothetical protein [Pontibacter sp. G13]WNJ19385.1 hypothetical protein RJD25_02735 [Pontibacter sp. G13]
MNNKIQAVIIIFMTLIIGFGAGFVASGNFFRDKVRKYQGAMNHEEQFMDMLINVADLSDEQIEQIKPVVGEHHQRMRGYNRTFRDSMMHERKIFHEELGQYLDEAQLREVKEHLRIHRKKRKMRHKPKGGPQGADGAPPFPPDPHQQGGR